MNRATFTRRVALTSVCALAAEATVGFADLKLSATTDKDSALFALSDAFWRVHNEIWSADYLAEHEYGSPEQKRLALLIFPHIIKKAALCLWSYQKPRQRHW